jgi:enterochelin esterase-like enzyme
MAITRRQLLVGAAGLAGAGIAAKALIGPSYDYSGTVRIGTFTSAARQGVATSWTINWPPGYSGAALRPLIVLHGRGGDHTSAYNSLHLDSHLASIVDNGRAPFALASVDGGDHSYWHPRADGDAAAMVTDEFLPLLSRHGLDTSKVGLLGWSMGGYGALYLASLLRDPRVGVAVAESPAIWHQAAQSVAGAFDNAADFNAHQLWGRQSALEKIPLRIDCGGSDGFAPVTRDLRASLHPTPAGGIESGGHDVSYWRSQATAQLTFVSQHLPK